MASQIYDFLKKYILKSLKLTALGFKGMLISLGFNFVYDKFLTPIYTWFETEIKLYFTKKKTKKNIEEVKNAKTKTELDNSFNDLLNGK